MLKKFINKISNNSKLKSIFSDFYNGLEIDKKIKINNTAIKTVIIGNTKKEKKNIL